MKRLSKEARKLAQEGMPRFVEAVRQAARRQRLVGKVAPLPITLEEFGEDFLLLYACLWLATCKGIAVTVVPRTNAFPPPANENVH